MIPSVCLPAAIFKHFISLKMVSDFITLLARSPLLCQIEDCSAQSKAWEKKTGKCGLLHCFSQMLYQLCGPQHSFVSMSVPGEGRWPSLGHSRVHPVAESNGWVIQWVPVTCHQCWIGKKEKARLPQVVLPWRNLFPPWETVLYTIHVVLTYPKGSANPARSQAACWVGCHSFSEQPVPVPPHPRSKELLPNI